MSKPAKPTFIILMMILTLVMSLVFPLSVLADDGLPPEEPGTSDGEVAETGEEVPPGDDATEESSEGEVTAPKDEVVEEGEDETEVTEEEISEVTEEVIPSDQVSTMEIIETMDETGAVLVDENGSPIPLATEEALELLTVPDPYIVRGGVTYRFLPAGGCAAFPGDPNCTESATPIQSAINFSLDGETIFVDPGTYVEQLNINKDITLQATAPGAIIKSPNVLTDFFVSAGPNNHYPIIYVHDTDNASIIGFTIDGDGKGNSNYRFDGIAYFNAGGTIQGNAIQNIVNTPFSGSQHGVGIFVYATDGGSHTIVIDDNVIENYQKNGITVSGGGITAEITDNVVTGVGPTATIAQNGIQVSGGANALIEGNTVTGNVYTPQTVVSTGILFFGPGNVEIIGNDLDGNDVNAYITGASSAQISGNTFKNGVWDGVWIDTSGTTTITDNDFIGNAEGVGLWGMTNMANVHINGNVFTGNMYGVYNYDAIDVDATGNFWGCPAGPDDSACDQVSTFVIYDPWLTTNPFVTGGGGGEPPEDDDDDRILPPLSLFTFGALAFAGGPLSGEATPLSCDTDETTLSVGGVDVTFSGLCGYDVVLEPVTEDQAQSALDGGGTFLHGVSITILKDGVPVQSLPADAQVIISFPVSEGMVMQWTGSWAEVDSTTAGGRLDVQGGPGIYIVIDK